MGRMTNRRGAALLIGVSVPTIQNLIRERSIPFYRVRSRVVFDEEELIAWLRARRVPAMDEEKAVTPGVES